MKTTFSLKTKITIVFVFLFILLILAVIPFSQMQEHKANENTIRNYERLEEHVRRERLSEQEVVAYFESLGFVKAKNPRKILSSGQRPLHARRGFALFSFNDHYYLHIEAPDFRILFFDQKNKVQHSYIDVFVIVFVVLLFIFIYYLILKNINDTAHQLKSRQLFLRTVMHELKTPIAKGRIVSELIDDEKQKKRIITIFEKLNSLVEDFAKVEQIVSKNYTPNMHSCQIDILIQKSIDMLMLENSNNIICENISTNKINIDLDLFALALKNLIDNGLKYSHDTKVTIKEEEASLLVISKGSKLQKPLDEYFKPFHNDTKQKTHGMGLGLYIVDSILQMHHMQLAYDYLNGKNIFKIIFQK